MQNSYSISKFHKSLEYQEPIVQEGDKQKKTQQLHPWVPQILAVPPSEKENNKDKTVRPTRKRFFNAVNDERSPYVRHSQERKFTENVEYVKVLPH